MAVDIFNPPAGSPLGPGIPYQVRQLPVVPIVPPGHWEIGIWDNALPNTMVVRQIHRFTGEIPSSVAAYFGDPAIEHTYLPSSRTLTTLHSEVTMRARLLEQNGSVLVAESSVLGVWDSSFSWMLPASTTGSGFTQADRDDLVLVKAAVQTNYSEDIPGAIPLIGRAIDLLRGPPRSLLTPFGSMLLEGRGTIPVVPEGTVAAFGGTWTWFRVPPGAGYRDGVLKRYSGRILQLQIIARGAGSEIYSDVVVEENAEGGHVLWKFPFPVQIAFDLPPVWQATWQWLI